VAIRGPEIIQVFLVGDRYGDGEVENQCGDGLLGQSLW